MKRKTYKNIFLILITMLLLSVHTPIFADVGSFESYDSGDSWDYDYSYDDYDYDYDYDYDQGRYDGDDYSYSNSGNSYGGTDMLETIGLMLFVIVVIVMASKKKNTRIPRRYNVYRNNQPASVVEENVEEKVKKTDELFNEEQFIAWAKDVFVKMQEAWSKRDWSVIRCFETNDLFEQHQKQLEGYIENHQINKMERICVKSAHLSKFEQSGDKDILTVILNSKMIDYIIDDRTQEIIKGDRTTERHSTYKMVFIRKTGVKTKEENGEINAINCPNCGAPTQIASSGKCEYCGTIVTTGEFNWVLANLEKIAQ